jgi:saccharopine dehydrogenase-like NADP-dependent oxidoreductase
MRVLVLGGYGNFGARICSALVRGREFEVVAAGRDPERGARRAGFKSVVQAARIDLASPDLAPQLEHLAPAVVIHCAGPFQAQDYRVARACIAIGAHYVDLADSRAFVARFAEALDRPAKAAGLLATSGASTLPALSSAVVDALAGRFRELREIRITIAPGARVPRGEATLAAVLSYAGRPFKWRSGGEWNVAHGWQNLTRVRIPGLGVRWAAACDVPDLELFPKRYPTAQTVEFRAALELSAQHLALWAAAGWRRIGLPLPLENWSARLDRFASWMNRFGSDRGGMLVSVVGVDQSGTVAGLAWHVIAEAGHGPEIPCMAAILIVRKLSRGDWATRGAMPCMGLLSLEEFAPEFERWGMATEIRRITP